MLVYTGVRVMEKQQVYDDLKRKIVKEQLLPGTALVERELCSSYGMSRTPIREVLWRLNADGLLEQIEGRGFAVRTLKLEHVFEIFQAREAVEGMAARLACGRGTAKFQDLVRELAERLRAIDVETETARAVEIGRRLHNGIIAAAANGLLSETYVKLSNLAILTSNLCRRAANIERQSKELHLAIMKALLEHDETNAELLMRQHLRTTCRLFVETFYPGL
jgi:DNA-binding GntR family transcriptional regulator